MKSKLILIICFLFSIQLFSQTQTPGVTVGLLYSDNCNISEGYILYTASQSNMVYLIDNCGYVVNEWTFNNTTGYPSAYLLPDGSVAKLNRVQNTGAPYGIYCLEQRDWNNNLIWEYCSSGRYEPMHSDLAYLPNGNFLVIVQDAHSATAAVQKGIDPANFGNAFYSESVIEFERTGLTTGNVVWEWHLWDHLVQDINPNIPSTYGVISNNPGKMDANIIDDVTHFNSIWYLEDRDHIMLSNWKNDEIFIIDHGISSVEAADTLGDLLWRWGNPENYDLGTIVDKRLDGMHNPRLISNTNPLYPGMFSVHNNLYHNIAGLSTNRSAAVILDDVYDAATNSYPKDPLTGRWLPNDFNYVWYGDVFQGDNYYSQFESGVQVQANGNIILTEALSGRIVEVNPDGEVVWIYKTPDSGGLVADQGFNSNGDLYKSEKYAPTYSGIINTNTIGLVENNNSVSQDCENYTPLTTDASLFSIEEQNNNLSCSNNISPKFLINNTGLSAIISVDLEYSINGGATAFYSWSGNLVTCGSEEFIIPGVLLDAQDEIILNIINVNGAADDDLTNNLATKIIANATFTDSGGVNNNYSNNENQTYTICPTNSYLESVEVTFTHVDIDVQTFNGNGVDCQDNITVYNGNSNNASILSQTLCGELSGTGQIPVNVNQLIQAGDVFTSTDVSGCLTFEFLSDVSDTDDGWEADIACVSNGNVCPISFNLGIGTIPSATYQADDFIYSNGKVNLSSLGDVDYLVGDQYIELDSGFEADGTVTFTAAILDCDINN